MPAELNNPHLFQPASVLVVGCGFVGSELVRVFHQPGMKVVGITLTTEAATQVSALLKVEIVPTDVGNEAAVATIAKHLAQRLPRPLATIHCASSNRGGPPAYRNVFLNGTRNILRFLKPERFIFTSSTSVYAQVNGEIVDETSTTAPLAETSQILLEAEQITRASGGIVTRLAGLYGPGRCVYLEQLKSRTTVPEAEAERFVNMLHRDDAVSAIQFLVQNGIGGEVYNVVDNTPRTLRELYAILCHRAGLPLPAADVPTRPQHARKRPYTSKRVSNTRLRQLGWSPRYPAIETAWATLNEASNPLAPETALP